MTALRDSSEFTGPVTEGSQKTFINDLRAYLAELLGTDGTVATALDTLGALASTYQVKTAAYTVLLSDRGSMIDATTGTWTLSLPAAASAGAGFSLILRTGTGVITIDPSGAELIDGVATKAIAAGRCVIMMCTGTAWISDQMANTLPAGTIVGNNTGATAASIALTPSQIKTMLAITGADITGLNLTNLPAATFKQAVEAVMTTNFNLAVGGLGTAADGQTVTAGDRILCINQTAPAENFIYVASAGAWSRATDADNGAELRGAVVTVNKGTLYGGTQWVTDFSGTLGTNPITMRRIVNETSTQTMTNKTLTSPAISGGTVDGATVGATTPATVRGTNVTATGYIVHGVSAKGTVAPGALALGTNDFVTVTPNATGTFTTTVPPLGVTCKMIITTTGTTSFTLTFGTGFLAAASPTLATGIVAGKIYILEFVSNGSALIETRRLGPF